MQLIDFENPSEEIELPGSVCDYDMESENLKINLSDLNMALIGKPVQRTEIMDTFKDQSQYILLSP